MFISPAFAQDGGIMGSFGSLGGILPLILIFVVFYFLLIRPQQKKVKEHRAMLDALRRGDKIVTNGGIIGKVTRVDEQFFVIEVAKGVELKLQKHAVSAALPKGTIKKI